MDFEVGVGEVLPTFRAGNPTEGGVPDITAVVVVLLLQ